MCNITDFEAVRESLMNDIHKEVVKSIERDYKITSTNNDMTFLLVRGVSRDLYRPIVSFGIKNRLDFNNFPTEKICEVVESERPHIIERFKNILSEK